MELCFSFFVIAGNVRPAKRSVEQDNTIIWIDISFSGLL